MPSPRDDQERRHQENIRAISRVEKSVDGLCDRVTLVELKVPAQLEVRLDRLEQADKRKDIWTGAAIVAAVSGFGAAVWSLITNGHKP